MNWGAQPGQRREAKARGLSPSNRPTMAIDRPFQGVRDRAAFHILPGRQRIDLSAVSTEAFWLLDPHRTTLCRQSRIPDPGTQSRKSPRLACDRYLAASAQNGRFSRSLLNHPLHNQPQSYFEAPKRLRVSPISKPRACKPIFSLRRASCNSL